MTGRIKELIITAGGENVPSIIIEETIKKMVPIISNVMVVGDKKKFLSCLLTLKVKCFFLIVNSSAGSLAVSTVASCPRVVG